MNGRRNSFWRFSIFMGNGTGIDRASRIERRSPQGRLRVGLVGKTDAALASPAKVAFCRCDHVQKSLRPADGIAPFQQFDDGVRTHVQTATDIAVLSRGHQGQVAAVIGHPKALANVFEQRHPEDRKSVV